MELWELLEIPAGVTAVIGGGGKTSLLRALGRELSRQHRVVLCTTTKIYPFPDLPCARTAAELNALAGEPLICTGTDAPGGKLTVPPVSLTELARIYDYVLVEADGSAGRPMKAHAAHEPVIPPEARRRLLVVGASGFGCPIEKAAHRPERYAALAGAALTDPVTPQTQAMTACISTRWKCPPPGPQPRSWPGIWTVRWRRGVCIRECSGVCGDLGSRAMSRDIPADISVQI